MVIITPKEHLLIFCDAVVHVILLRSLPDILALADAMIMLSMRPAEVKTLCIENGYVTGFAKCRDDTAPRKFLSMEKNEARAQELLTWIQKSIDSGILRDPGKPGVKWFNTYLKQYNIKPSDLRKIGLDHLSRVHGGRNDSHHQTFGM